MVKLYVSFEPAIWTILVKDQAVEIADVASVQHVIVVSALLVSQLSECVDDNSENDIQADDIDNDLEGGIMHELKQILLSLVQILHWLGDIPQTSTISHTLI
tara:strand:- start:836 stop:1141 length:306 start_codon:yes stop_codon:yes gene_type:complete